MKYLVIGAGGTGGLIGGYLAKAQKDVTLVARGAHLRAIQNKGLTIKTYGFEPVTVRPIVAIAEEDIADQKFDVIFVTVKAYSLANVVIIIKKASHLNTLVIPILNSLGAGNYLRQSLPDLQIYDGCIYITGYLSAPGEVSQNNTIFRIVYGLNKTGNENAYERIVMETDLRTSGIEVRYSTSITSEIFRKLTFTSAFAAVAAYHNKQAFDLQVPGKHRHLFLSLLEELCQIATSAQFNLDKQVIFENNITILDSLSADFTASFQKDLMQGKPDEREQLIFDIVRLAEKHNVNVPMYLKIAYYFGYKLP